MIKIKTLLLIPALLSVCLCNTNKKDIIPQFRSIIPCEVLLYIEVTFLGFIH